MGTQAPVVTQPAVVGGVLHGGQSPIQGSTVTLYETDSTATTYGAAGIKIGTGTSDINGNFTISPAVSTSNCTAGNMSYMVASGGYPSGQATLANTGTLMMIALGDCANLSSASRVVINELTTVAAAYSLSGFMTTSSGVANVSAPAANSALTGTVSAAAGMPHAFLNAATLVNSQGSINPYTISSSAGVTINGTIPGSLINTLADILQSCINGATGNTSCTSLYGFTPSITGVAPTNTLQSMINLARNPYPSAAAMTQASGLFSLISASPAFQPVLTSQPPDYSIAIVYKGTPLVGPYDIALDANDTVYAGLSGSTNVVGLSTYGVTVPAFTAGTGSATRQIAADSLGNIWVTNDASLVLGYNTSTGGAAANTITLATSGNATFGVAVDANSNLWIANDDAITGNLIEYKYTAATTVPVAAATYTANYTSTAAGSFLPTEITIDNSQNIWVAAYYTGGTYADVLPNLSAASTSATPTYTSSGTTITPISATFASSATKPLGVVIDASGNAWYGITGSNTVTTTGIEEVLPTQTASVITALVPQPLVANATLGAKASQIPGIDGAGTIYLPDNQGTGSLGIHVYSTVAVKGNTSQVLSPPSGYLGCYTAGGSTCDTGSTASPAAVYNPRQIVIDSTGSVWAGITSGGFTQIIGLGAPTWPLASVGKPGLSPGLTTVTALP